MLQAGQSLQAQLEDRLRLRVGQVVTARGGALLPSEFRRETFRSRGLGGGALEHVLDQSRAPALGHQGGLRLGRRGRGLDHCDDFVDVRQRDGEPLEDVTPFAGLGQLVTRTADDHFPPMGKEVLEELLEREQARLVVDQRDHVHAEAILKLRELVQVVEDDVGDLAALELDHHAHA